MSRRKKIIVMMIAAIIPFLSERSLAEEDFYKGKVVSYNLATTPGGSWDSYLRVFTRHFPKHIPGNPRIVIQYMPGGGGIRALNYVYTIAPKDGTYIATPLPTSLLYAQMNPKDAVAKLDQLVWVGSMAPTQDIISVWHTGPVQTIEDAKRIEITMGATGAGSNTFFDLMLANHFVGTKFKPILGYQGSAEIDIAIERGELGGRAVPWDGWVTGRPQWLADGKLIHLMQVGLKKSSEIGDVPLLSDLIKNKEDKEIADLVGSYYTLGRTIYLPMSVPVDRVKMLRDAFIKTMTDPEYLAEAKSLKLNTGEFLAASEIENILKKTLSTSTQVLEKAKTIITP